MVEAVVFVGLLCGPGLCRLPMRRRCSACHVGRSNTLAPVRVLLATAHEEGLIRSNPSTGVRVTNPAQTGDDAQEPPKALTEPELQLLLSATPESHRLLIEFLSQTGLRIGEAIALTWVDVDLGTHRVHVNKRLYRNRLARPKSTSGTRAVPLSPSMAQRLWTRRGTAPDDALVFPSQTGTPLDPSNLLARTLKPAARAAGVPWAGHHTLRHTCASMLFRNGINVAQVSAWLGHNDAGFTLRTYIHLIPDDLPDPIFFDEPTTTETPARQELDVLEPAQQHSASATRRPG